MQTEINANAMNVPSNITTFSHLVLSMHPTNYAIKSPITLPPPANLGSGPTIYQKDIAPTIAQANFLYKIEKTVQHIPCRQQGTQDSDPTSYAQHFYQ